MHVNYWLTAFTRNTLFCVLTAQHSLLYAGEIKQQYPNNSYQEIQHSHHKNHVPSRHSPPKPAAASSGSNGKQWLAGDHHTHSIFSAGWRYKGIESKIIPPIPVFAGDALYTVEKNAEMAQLHGLSWLVITDHGGPWHSKLNLNKAYPALLAARDKNPNFLIFYGMEFDTPGAEHSTLIIPHSHQESQQLFNIESRYNRREPFPPDPARSEESFMDEALKYMNSLSEHTHELPIIIANHPGRSMDGQQYTKVSPSELRRWNNIAPQIAVGMEGAPGHQARALRPDGSIEKSAPRGGYKKSFTMGGFDQFTAKLGGFWDSMLGEGRHWWITANSDSHRHWQHGGDDFWPGEYSKTYVLAETNYASILQGIRQGRVFVTTGDLVSKLDVSLELVNKTQVATIGETLFNPSQQQVRLHIGFFEPGKNASGDVPKVTRVDVIQGKIERKNKNINPELENNTSTKVIARIKRKQFVKNKEGYLTTTIDLRPSTPESYIRIRGTNTTELEPQRDDLGENPWQDLWFYSNPIFISDQEK